MDFITSTLKSGTAYLQQLVGGAEDNSERPEDDLITSERRPEEHGSEKVELEDEARKSKEQSPIDVKDKDITLREGGKGTGLDPENKTASDTVEKTKQNAKGSSSKQEPEDCLEEIARNTKKNDSSKSISKAFDPDYMAELFRECLNEEDETVNAYKFILACRQVPKLMDGMGRSLKIGNSKLYEKLTWLERRLNEAAKDLGHGIEELSLQDMIERDIANGWTHTGKPTNHATRNIVRMVWFLDFIIALFNTIAEETEAGSLRKTILDVYKTSLGTHHPYSIRKVTETGIKLSPIPNRRDFAKHLGFDDLQLEEQADKLIDWAKAAEDVSSVLWKYIDSRNLRDVP